ncbi:hypothetical protein HDE_06040 [Halotydeus destructor]|nr:hypothetical protein HDE_06040 [Halotydeus destructor]
MATNGIESSEDTDDSGSSSDLELTELGELSNGDPSVLHDVTVPTYSNNGHSGAAMTIKEFHAKLDDLRRENFNLKLRLYFLEKDRNGLSRNSKGRDSYERSRHNSASHRTPDRPSVPKVTRNNWTQTEEDSFMFDSTDNGSQLEPTVQPNIATESRECQTESLVSSVMSRDQCFQTDAVCSVNTSCQVDLSTPQSTENVFTADERLSLRNEVDNLKQRRDNMERMISLQARKADKMIKKATLHISQLDNRKGMT